VQLAITNVMERILPTAVFSRFEPLLEKVDESLSGDEENAVSQRMAMFVFAIRVASAAIALLSQALLARWLGVFEYGIFVAVWAGIIIASAVTGLGIPSAVVRFVAEYRERNRPSLLWGIVKSSYIVSFGVATFTATIGTLLLLFFPELITNYFVMPVILGLLCLPAFAIEGVSDTTGRPFNWIKLSFLPTFILRPLSILLLMGATILAGIEPTAVIAMWCSLIATYIITLFQACAIIYKLRKTVPLQKPAKYRPRYWLAVALPIFLVESFYILLTQVDVVFVSWLTDPEQTAVYFAAAKILALVHFVYFAIRSTASPRFAAYSTSGKFEEYRAFVQKTVQWTFWPSLFLGGVMILTGEYFLALFGPEFVVGERVLWVLVAGIVIRASVGPAESILVMSGKQNMCAIAYCGALLMNVMLNLYLIPIYGMMGAAIATAIAMGFESLGLYLIVRNSLGIHAFIIPQRSRSQGA